MSEIPDWWMQRGPAYTFLAHKSELYLWPRWPCRKAEIGEVTRKGIREVNERIQRREARNREELGEGAALPGQSEDASSFDLSVAAWLFDGSTEGENSVELQHD